jgi:hypothetical protein
MTRKRLAWVCLLVSPLVIGGVVLVLLPRDSITQANCDKIKKGMTEKEVEAILGREKDWVDEFAAPSKVVTYFVWQGSRGTILVGIADPIANPPLVVDAIFWKSSPQTVVEKMRDLLGL